MLEDNVRQEDSTTALTAPTTSRRSCLVASALILSFSKAAFAFEGGIGGLGKTKPETGVQFWNPDFAPSLAQQNSNAAGGGGGGGGLVTAELNINNQPVLVSFCAPWPLLSTTAGLEARDLQLPESAFVQVITAKQYIDLPTTKTQARDILLNSVLGPQGKFGAYGTPVDVKVKAVDDSPKLMNQQLVVVYRVSFTAYTPGLRETDRQAFVAFHKVAGSAALVLLVVGTTQIRFAQKEEQLLGIISSLEVVPAPTTTTTRRS
jgi:hypothetical protein